MPSRHPSHAPLLALAMLCALAAGCARPGGTAATGGPVNVLLVTIDTVRADHLGCYGDRAAETPRLDRLAGQGVRFADASSAVPLTLPSHSSLLSGLLPPHHGLRNNGAGSFPSGSPTLATALSAAGYRTGAFVGSFVLDRRFGLARGFATYDDEIERDPRAGAALEAERPGSVVVDRALAWLGKDEKDNRDNKDGGRPFFLWVHLYDAHAPYTPPSPWRERFAGRPYDGEIASVDAQVGRLLDELDRRGLAASTVVAVASDHGEALGEHGEATHGLLLYQPTLHVPLLLRAPGLRAGQVVRTPVSLVDLAPTLAGLAGKALSSAPLDGRDLSAGLLRGEEPAPSDLYAETRYPALFGWSPLTALRRRDLKYIDGSEPEMYDLAKDPREAANLAARAESARTAAGFAEQIAKIEAGAVATQRVPADAETRAKLASLGYATGSAPSKPAAPAARPTGASPARMAPLFLRFEHAHQSVSAGKTAEALPELEALVAADPRNSVFRGELAKALREQGQVARAVPLYRQAAEDAPADPEAWYNLAAALQETGRLDEARAALRQAMHLDPGRPEAHNTLGIVLLGERKPDEARKEFEIAATLDRRDAYALNNLGNTLRGLGRLDEAERAYRRAVAASPRYAEAWNGLGTLEVDRDRPSAALSYFEQALRLAPRYHEVRLNRAIAYELAGQTDAAVAAYRDFLAATESDPQFSEQRRAAQQLLARLSHRATGLAPDERR
jgi:arylsulfatase A-like enzyme/Flp pilus assembly protein TadD